MYPVITDLLSGDLHDLQTDHPANPTNFAVAIEFAVGSSEASEQQLAQSGELFQVIVCTPQWLEGEVVNSPDRYIWLRHKLLVAAWDYGRIRQAIESMCRSCEAPTWLEAARRLSRYASWEFEDYDDSWSERFFKAEAKREIEPK